MHGLNMASSLIIYTFIDDYSSNLEELKYDEPMVFPLMEITVS